MYSSRFAAGFLTRLVLLLPQSWFQRVCFCFNMINKNIPSSDAVKCGKPQIRPLNHEVFQTSSYLSHV